MRALATLCIAAGLSLALHAGPATAQEAPLPPVDAGAKDPSWVQFHKRLVAAVEQRDVKFLLSILDPKVRNSFEKPDGVKAFIEQWDLDTPAKAKDSPLWAELRSMLRFGAAPVEAAGGERLLCLPYVAVTFPPTIDPYLFAAVVIADAPVFSKPSTQAQIVATLSHQIVGVEDWDLEDEAKSPQRWVKVVLKQGGGYMASEHVRSAIEARGCFTRSRGKTPNAGPWRMMSLTVGGG
ncbi:MAG: hypothetical protein K2W80_13825 [Burkholderiales bacterium]|nr:hypothetical protein [Burkholderiales bacterium]